MILAAALCLPLAFAAAADQIFIPINIAAGAMVTASSTSNSGGCVSGRCSASNVIGLASNNATGQWVSQPGTCDVSRAETLTVDWSQNFGVQYITEVRYRFGTYDAQNTNLVVYDTQPMNINNPTAVTYINEEQWVVYVFEIPVTSTSLSFTWTGLSSPDNGVSCQLSVRDVQVWTGPSPDGINGIASNKKISSGAIAGIIFATVLVVVIIGVVLFVCCLRRKNLSQRRNRAFELMGVGRGQRLVDENEEREVGGFEALSKRLGGNARTKNFLATVNQEAVAGSGSGSASSTATASKMVVVQDTYALRPHAEAGTVQSPSGSVVPFLGAVTSAGAAVDAVVLTVQASGVSIHDTVSNHCLHSFSVPQAVSFASPAVFVQQQQQQHLQEGQEDQDDQDEDALAVKDSLSGFVYAPVIDATAKAHGAKRLWVWAVGSGAKAAKIGGKSSAGGPGKPDWAKTFDANIQHVAAHARKFIIVFHSTNAIALFKHDLVKPAASSKAKPTSGSVVWTQASPVSYTEKSAITEAISIVKSDSGVLSIRNIRVETVFGVDGAEDSHTITFNESPLPVGDFIPISYSFAVDQKKLYVALSNSEVRAINLKTITLANTIKLESLNLSVFAPTKASPSVPISFTMKPLGKSYLAVVGSSKKDQDILSIWDTRFGTLQLKRVLNGDNDSGAGSADPTILIGKAASFGRSFDIEPASSSLSGPVLAITTSIVRSKPEKNTVSFASSVSLAPYYCPPVSLLSAFGKLSNSLKFSLETGQEGTLPGLATIAQPPPVKNTSTSNWFTGLVHLEDLDKAYVTRITSPSLSPEAMSLELARWIYEKTVLTTPNSTVLKPADHSVVDLSTYPVIEISQPAMIKLLTRALGNTKDFYPIRVIQYLVRTGRVPACITIPDPSTEDQTRCIGIVEQVLAQNDFQTLCQLLHNDQCIGLNEYDVLQIVQYVCCTGNSSTHDNDGEMERRRNTIDVYVKNQVGSNKTAEYKKCLARSSNNGLTGSKKGGAKVFDGRRWFFEKVFAIPQENDFVFAKALKQLNVDQVEVVVGWVVGLLEVDVRLKTEVARKRAASEKRKEIAAKGASNSGKKKGGVSAAAIADATKFGFVDQLSERDLDECLAESEVRRQLWWLWDTPGKKNEYSDAVCQAIDVVNLIIDVHLTTILLTPSLHELIERLKVCISSDLHMFNMMQRKLNGALSVFELSEAAKTKAAASVAGLSGDQKVQKKQEVVGTELRKRWKRMVAQVNDGVGSYAVEVMGI
ncbi:UNVERIFIED_CONTAM: Nucleolar protein 11 [Siphonaria sp. JEL0065]|nr:Nucleolar protein 11 [Siphonaria sp. JEL0065]